MKIAHYEEIEPHVFEPDGKQGTTARVVIGKKDGANNFCMRVIELAAGTVSHQHSHEWEHEVMVHSGKGEILCEGEWRQVDTGHVIFIPGNEEHQLRNLNDEPFVFVCLVPSNAPEI